jgi:hypothetical protein
LLALFASLVEWLVVSSGGNPAVTNIPRSGQNCDVVPLCGRFFNDLDSRLRGNDGLMDFLALTGFPLDRMSACPEIVEGRERQNSSP